MFQSYICGQVLNMTIVPINDLSRWDDSERDRINRRIQEVVESGHFMLGSNTKELESQLSSRLDGMNVMCVGNGTDALSVAILGPVEISSFLPVRSLP